MVIRYVREIKINSFSFVMLQAKNALHSYKVLKVFSKAYFECFRTLTKLLHSYIFDTQVQNS